jgi:aldose 1-epimerase
MIRLQDDKNGVDANIDPRGLRVVSLLFNSNNVLHTPGIPFLAPWANRMPEGFHVDGKFYALRPNLGNLQTDAAGIPIHGLLTESDAWEITARNESSFTARLQFWRYPAFMAQWPFAHEYEMTMRLAGGAIEISVTIRNMADVRMPVAVGFHPYLRIRGVPRKEWSVRVPAGLRVIHDERSLPTGEFADAGIPDPAPLDKFQFDGAYTALEERAQFRIEGGRRAIEMKFGPTWPVAIVWGPENEEFLCIEPMAAVTNGINLHHKRLWPKLQWIAPGGLWKGDFSIRGEGF